MNLSLYLTGYNSSWVYLCNSFYAHFLFRWNPPQFKRKTVFFLWSLFTKHHTPKSVFSSSVTPLSLYSFLTSLTSRTFQFTKENQSDIRFFPILSPLVLWVCEQYFILPIFIYAATCLEEIALYGHSLFSSSEFTYSGMGLHRSERPMFWYLTRS